MPELLRYIHQSEIEVGAKVPNFTLLDMNNLEDMFSETVFITDDK